MNEIEITFKNKARTFYVHPHFLVQLRERATHSDSPDALLTPDNLLNAVYIEDRPNNIAAIIKNARYAVFLWDDTNRLVFVIDENEKTKRLDTLKTVYASPGCDWLLRWQAAHPKAKRQRLRDVFNSGLGALGPPTPFPTHTDQTRKTQRDTTQ